MAVDITSDRQIHGSARLRAGDVVHASLTFADEGPAVLPLLGEASRAAIDRTVGWWRDWAARLRYAGPRREMVVRGRAAVEGLTWERVAGEQAAFYERVMAAG